MTLLAGTGRRFNRSYLPPPPPPPPPPPDDPPPPEPELDPGGDDAEDIVELRLDPIEREKSPRFEIGPRPLYHGIVFAASAAAAAPAA